jgi:hypothetical protein
MSFTTACAANSGGGGNVRPSSRDVIDCRSRRTELVLVFRHRRFATTTVDSDSADGCGLGDAAA